MKNTFPWLLSAVFALLWWRGRRTRKRDAKPAARPLAEAGPPKRDSVSRPAASPAQHLSDQRFSDQRFSDQHLSDQRFPNQNVGLQIEAAEPAAEHLGARRRWLGVGVGIGALAVAALLFSAALNRIPVTPDPNQQTAIVADGPSTLTALAGSDPARAPALFRSYGCVSCHTIPGIPGAYGRVGPNLAHLYDHALIAGVLENTPQNLVRWIRFPQQVDPKTGMPSLGVTEQDARDLAAYLQSFR